MNEEFKKFLNKICKNNTYGIIYVYADWCQKCKLLDNSKLKYDVFYVNADNEQDLLEILDIRILPTFFLINCVNNKNYSFNILSSGTTLEDILDLSNIKSLKKK